MNILRPGICGCDPLATIRLHQRSFSRYFVGNQNRTTDQTWPRWRRWRDVGNLVIRRRIWRHELLQVVARQPPWRSHWLVRGLLMLSARRHLARLRMLVLWRHRRVTWLRLSVAIIVIVRLALFDAGNDVIVGVIRQHFDVVGIWRHRPSQRPCCYSELLWYSPLRRPILSKYIKPLYMWSMAN